MTVEERRHWLLPSLIERREGKKFIGLPMMSTTSPAQDQSLARVVLVLVAGRHLTALLKYPCQASQQVVVPLATT
jgi:hypothetical protein